MDSRRYRWLVAANVIVTLLPVAGSKRYPAPPTIVANVAPSVEPSTDSVSVRAPQAEAGGSLSTIRLTVVAVPRPTSSQCGNALLALSQKEFASPSSARLAADPELRLVPP